MEAMKQSWNDDRIGDLSNRVDVGFAQVDAKIDATAARLDAKIDETAWKTDAKIDEAVSKLDAEIDAKVDRLDAKIDRKIDAAALELRLEIKEGVHQINSRFDAMQQTMIRIGGGLIGVLIVALSRASSEVA